MMVGSNDLDRSKKFYDALFGAVGGKEAIVDPKGRLMYLHNGGIFMRKGAAGAEAYPLEPGPKTGAGDLYVGTPGAFAAAGYDEVARPLPRRPVMSAGLT